MKCSNGHELVPYTISYGSQVVNKDGKPFYICITLPCSENFEKTGKMFLES